MKYRSNSIPATIQCPKEELCDCYFHPLAQNGGKIWTKIHNNDLSQCVNCDNRKRCLKLKECAKGGAN